MMRVGIKTVKDKHNLGTIDVTTVLAKSSNVGMAKIALSLQPQQMWTTLDEFGFGRVTGSGFPGESAGMLTSHQHWRSIGQATMSYGYGLSVTPLQLAQAYAVLGAGGIRRPVSLRRVEVAPAGERVLDETVARELVTMMEAVVSDAGTARRARVMGYRVAGKTGTAWKASGDRRLFDQQVHGGVRRCGAGEQPASRGGRHHRRAERRRVLRRRSRRAGVLGGDVGRAAPARDPAGRPAAHAGDDARAGAGPVVSRGEDPGMNAVADDTGAPEYRSTLAALLEGAVQPLRDVEDRDLTLDSRSVTPGAAFLACQGRTTHGVVHAATAVERGAVAVLWEPAPGVEAPSLPAHVAVHAVPDLAQRAGDMADRFFARPSLDLRVAGFTGTNGKTTSAYLLAQAADSSVAAVPISARWVLAGRAR